MKFWSVVRVKKMSKTVARLCLLSFRITEITSANLPIQQYNRFEQKNLVRIEILFSAGNRSKDEI